MLLTSSLVVPSFASSSAFSFPHNPLCAAIHRTSTVLLVAVRLIAFKQSKTVLLLMVHVVRAWIDDKLSVQMIMCLLRSLLRWLHASLIADSSAWKTVQWSGSLKCFSVT